MIQIKYIGTADKELATEYKAELVSMIMDGIREKIKTSSFEVADIHIANNKNLIDKKILFSMSINLIPDSSPTSISDDTNF